MPRKIHLGDQAERCGKIVFALAGKSHDEVGGEREGRARVAQSLDETEIIGPRMAAVHGGKNSVRTGLHGQMQLRHQLRQFAMCCY